ncbi:MAG TPA: KEOPS complex kinase/ATPase Bud32 [Candidatus Pacearchaeota archaeon]|nr:KEOPS complex kinase/ATPase Bud32 [Candidatus Pacearchaeota archaeon]
MERKEINSIPELISQGAEAKIFLDKKKNLIIKNRLSKSYRLQELDKKIIKGRTKSEIKLLIKANQIINAPLPGKNTEENKIIMPYVKGKKLSDNLNNFSLEKQKEILEKIGKSIAILHKSDIIHGDLTTSNMILTKSNEVFFIDFGLGYISKKIEDKAVDLHLLKQALEAKHFKNWEILFQKFKDAYSKNYFESKQIFERLIAVEKRGRYRH